MNRCPAKIVKTSRRWCQSTQNNPGFLNCFLWPAPVGCWKQGIVPLTGAPGAALRSKTTDIPGSDVFPQMFMTKQRLFWLLDQVSQLTCFPRFSGYILYWILIFRLKGHKARLFRRRVGCRMPPADQDSVSWATSPCAPFAACTCLAARSLFEHIGQWMHCSSTDPWPEAADQTQLLQGVCFT